MTVRRASEAYLRYQRNAEKGGEWPSLLERTRNRYGRLIDADTKVRDDMTDPTLLFLSLRLSPIRRENGRRRWIPPVALDSRLTDSWDNVYDNLRNQLREYQYEYVFVTAATRSAGTPHRHVLVYVEDPDDDIDIEVARSAVDSFVRNTKGAEHADHPVNEGQSDAGNIYHDIPIAEEGMRHREGNPFGAPSVPLYYMALQLPHWVIKQVYDRTSDINADSPKVDGAAAAWSSPNNWVGSSRGFPM